MTARGRAMNLADAEQAAFEKAYTDTPELIYEAFPQEIEPGEEAAFVAAMLKGEQSEMGRIYLAVCRRYVVRDTELVERHLHPKRDD